MATRLSPGPAPATPADLRAAQERDRLLRTELPRVREAATAWRNGLGALLAALVGFGLVKGRSDVSQLDPAWAVAVGVGLLLALIAGAVGALLLIRAAHGIPVVTPVRKILARRAADHMEALSAAKALTAGIVLTLTCAALLVGAVATTWYGPPRDKPAVEVTTPDGTVCGRVVRTAAGTMTLDTAAGEVPVELARASAIRAVTACPGR